MFKGSYVAIVTPFKEGNIDEDAFQHLVERQFQSGTQGIVIAGSTGEGLLLSKAEKQRLFTLAKEVAQDRFPLIACCSSPSTAQAQEMAQEAYEGGMTAVLVTAPSYVKPSQEGLYQHFFHLHSSSRLPIILYNHPGRTNVNLSDETLSRLAVLPTIIGLKDSNPDIPRLMRLRTKLPSSFFIFSGDDPTSASLLAMGGDGTISVAANLIPADVAQLVSSCQKGDMETFRALSLRTIDLFEALNIETNPTCVKYTLSLLGLCQNELRLPLLPATNETVLKINTVLTNMGLLGYDSSKKQVSHG